MQIFINYQLSLLLFMIGLSLGTITKKQAELKIVTKFKPKDCSKVAEDGDEVAVHYTGYLENGEIFDSSAQADRNPLVFRLGEKQVLPGWEMGIKGMCVGEKRRFVIPPHLGYGMEGYPPAIPGDATLTFDTHMIHIEKKPWNFDVVGLVQLLAIPAMVLYIVYYLFDRYRKEASETKELKKSKKRK